MPLFLRISRNDALVGIKQFPAGQITIGSDPSVTLPLQGNHISAIHCMIEDRGESYFVVDLGSEAGTSVNDTKIAEHALANGDVIGVGEFTLEFSVGIPKPRGAVTQTAAAPVAAAIPAAAVIPTQAPASVSASIPPLEKPVEKPAEKPVEVKPSQPVVPVEAPALVQAVIPAAAPVIPATPAVNEPVTVKTEPAKKDPVKTEPVKAEPTKVEPVKTETSKPVAAASAPAPVAPKPVVALPTEIAAKPKTQNAPTQAVAPKPTAAPAATKPTAPAESVSAAPLEKPAVAKGGMDVVPPATLAGVPFTGRHLKEVVRPSKGTTVEVVVGWQDRVLNTYHFSERKVIKVGPHPKNDIILPLLNGAGESLPLIKIDELAQIYIPMNIDGELTRAGSTYRLQDLMIQGKITRSQDGGVLQLQQEELVRLDFGSGISLYVRYVGATPKPVMLPWLDLTTGQLLAVFVASAAMFFGAALVQLTSPDPQDVDQPKVEEPIRKVTFKVPEKMKMAMLAEKTQDASAKQAEAPQPVKEKMQKAKGTPVAGPPSPPAEAKANNSQSKEKKLTALTVGKTGSLQSVNNKKNSGAASNAPKKPEVNVKNFGILNAFGGKGAQEQINKAVAGAEAVGGLGAGAGGRSGTGVGDNTNAGEQGLRTVGAGGKGTATIGVAGVKTNGRGGGTLGYGETDLGGKKGSKIIAGGAEESFTGTIDKEAIRRVVRANQAQLKACYERALNRDPSLSGKLVIEWVIAAGGLVSEAHVKTSSLDNSDVEQCCISRLKSWRFPEPPKNQEALVSFPFIFNRD